MLFFESSLSYYLHSLVGFENLLDPLFNIMSLLTVHQDFNIGQYRRDRLNRHINCEWTPSASRWYNWNTDASILESVHSITVCYICKGNSGRIIRTVRYPIGDCPSLVAQTLAMTIQLGMS